MDRLKNFISTTVLGGFTVVLPITLALYLLYWLFMKLTDIIQPLNSFLLKYLSLPEIVGDLIVFSAILFFCFFVGLVEKTKLGQYSYSFFEKKFFKKMPGYNIIKETILQFLGNKKSPFSSVCTVRLFENSTEVIAFVVDEDAEETSGQVTIFMPTGPNPTSGNIYLVKSDLVTKRNWSVEATMKTIISCGAGAGTLINNELKEKSHE